MLLNNRGYGEAWRLQYLTDLNELPDYERGLGLLPPSRPVRRSTPTATRSSTTCPRASRRPKPTASGGGGACSRRSSSNPQRRNAVRMQFAEFLWNQFGVQTMAHYGLALRPHGDRRHQEGRKRHLRPAHAGRKRDDRPAGHRHQAVQAARRVQLHQDLPADRRRSRRRGYGGRSAGSSWPRFSRTAGSIPRRPTTGGGCSRTIRDANRHCAARTGSSGWTRSSATGAASSRSQTQPAGSGATVEFRFRNGRQVEFTAHEINVEKLLDDVKAYLKSKPQPARLAEAQHRQHRLPAGRSRTRSSTSAARWPAGRLTLEPRENHFDKRVTVTTPLQKAGAYLLDRQDGRTATPATSSSGSTTRPSSRSRSTARPSTTSPTPSPASRSPRPTSSSSAGGRSTATSRRGTKCSPSSSPNSPTPTAR